MKLAIMQPYIFPYLGYWQLLTAVDTFVLLDDVNYINRGYINRNSILINGRAFRFSIPIENASQNRLIMNTRFKFDEKEKERFLKTIDNAYMKAPHYKEVYGVINKIINNPENDITSYIQKSIEDILAYLEIEQTIIRSSKINKNNTLHGQDRIIEICKKMNADEYCNPTGGRMLYDHKSFERNGIKLFFLDTRDEDVRYQQFDNEFVPNLSIIDVLVFNDIPRIKEMLRGYELNE